MTFHSSDACGLTQFGSCLHHAMFPFDLKIIPPCVKPFHVVPWCQKGPRREQLLRVVDFGSDTI